MGEEEEEDHLPPHKFTLPFAGDEIQHPQTRRDASRSGEGRRRDPAAKSAESRMIRGSWRLRCSRELVADSRVVRPQRSGPRSAALKGTISGQSIRCCHPAGLSGYK